MIKKEKTKKLIMKCKHDACQRLADSKDNKMGYCNECIQLNSKACNNCGTETEEKTNGSFNGLRALNYIILTGAGVVILGALVAAIISHNVQAVAGWASALLWFGGFIVMRRTADTYLDIAMMAIADLKRIEGNKK